MTYRYGDRVTTPDGPAKVIRDRRSVLHPSDIPYDRVWVLLDAGDNPQSYDAEELSPCES